MNTDLPMETLLRAIDQQRAEWRADLTQLRMDMREGFSSTVDRDAHRAEMSAMEHRVSALEQSRSRLVVHVVYPLVVAVLAAVATAVWLGVGGGV